VVISKLKEEQKILAMLNADQIGRLMHFKPKGKNRSPLPHCCIAHPGRGLSHQ
jgi:hypothetical protein